MNNLQQRKAFRIFGRNVYPCTISADVSRSEAVDVFFVLGHSECEVYNETWDKCFHLFPISAGTAEIGHTSDPSTGEQVKYLKILYTYNNNGTDQKRMFYLHYERLDLIMQAFQTDKKCDDEMSVLPFQDICYFACDYIKNETFRPFLETQARKRVMFLTSSNEISDALSAAIAIEFRMRFPQIEVDNWTEAFDVLWLEFVSFTVSLWTQILHLAIEPHTGPNTYDYFRRLTASIASHIAKGADVFNVDRKRFLISVKKYLDTGDLSDVPLASRKIVSDIQMALGNIRKRWLLELNDLFEFTQLFSVAITIGQAISPNTEESDQLSSMLASWAVSLVDNMKQGPIIKDFRNGVEKLAVAVLKKNNDKRYGPDFHCILALWKLSELVKLSD